MAAREATAERTALADQVLLSDELVERARTHPCREGLALGRRLEQGLGTRTRGPGRGARHAPMVATAAGAFP